MDITPKNGGKHIWSESENLANFEQEWSMKPVTLNGMFDHTREFQVAKTYRGEKGVQIITPFYTHLG